MADLIDRGELLERIYSRFGRHSTKVIATVEEGRVMSDWAFLEPFLNAAPAVNRWISVEDALPEKDKSYITYAETTKYCNHNEIPEELRINVLYFNGEEWYDDECIYYNVTHYMPLPEPPESEAQHEST